MSSGQPVSVTWECWDCKGKIQQRFFPQVDGDPKKTDPDPPKPWVTVREEIEKDGELHPVKFYFCEGCAAARNEKEILDDVVNVTYTDIDPLDALELWRKTHLCNRCIHNSVCQYAPDENGVELLVTISKCGAHVPDVDQ
jgi:hypothetical protein